MVLDKLVGKKKKLVGLQAADGKINNVIGNLEAVQAMLHEITSEPGVKQRLQIARMRNILDTFEERIDRKDKERIVKKHGPPTPLPQCATVHVSTTDGVRDMVNTIIDFHQPREEIHTLYVDLEGDNLGRMGEFDLLQIYLPRAGLAYVVYAHVLQKAAFTTPGNNFKLRTLQDIFESTSIIKAFRDCRGDSDALYSHYGVHLDPASVIDVQLLECATVLKAADRKKVKSLDQAVRQRINLPRQELNTWSQIKLEGESIARFGPLWREKKGRQVRKSEALCRALYGTTADEVARGKVEYSLIEEEEKHEPKKINPWEEYPLRPEMLQYAIGDVIVMPLLYHHFARHERLTLQRKKLVEMETVTRIRDSQAEVFKPGSQDGPVGWTKADWGENGAESLIAILPPMNISKTASSVAKEW